MNCNTDYSLEIGRRLKALRECKELSHDKLSKELSEKYGIKISSDSLMNYEVSDPNHSKTGKNLGMRIEYLRCFANFYGVSTDYLLGLSNIKTPSSDMVSLISKTGLHEEIALSLFALNNIEPFTKDTNSQNHPLLARVIDEVKNQEDSKDFSTTAIRMTNIILQSLFSGLSQEAYWFKRFEKSAKAWFAGKGKFVYLSPDEEENGYAVLMSPEAASYFLSRVTEILEQSIWDITEEICKK